MNIYIYVCIYAFDGAGSRRVGKIPPRCSTVVAVYPKQVWCAGCFRSLTFSSKIHVRSIMSLANTEIFDCVSTCIELSGFVSCYAVWRRRSHVILRH